MSHGYIPLGTSQNSGNQVCDNRRCVIFKWGTCMQVSITFTKVWTLKKIQKDTCRDSALLIVSLLVPDRWRTDTSFCRELHWLLGRRSAAACPGALASVSAMRQPRRPAAAEKVANARFVSANKVSGFWSSACYSGPSPLHHLAALRSIHFRSLLAK